MQDNEYNIRTYEEGDETKIIGLLDIVFGGCCSVDYWIWQYKQNPGGFYSDLIVLAEDNGKLIGYYSDMPFKLKVGDEIMLAGQPMSTATHPDYRRRGIFEAIAKRTYSNASKNGVPITFGFAEVSPVYHGYIKKLGWHHICFLITNDMVINEKKALERHFEGKSIRKLSGVLAVFLKIRNRFKSRVKLSQDISIVRTKNFDERINGFWEKVSREYDIMLVKDKEFFDWRLRSPQHNYTIFIAEKENKMIGYIILADGKEDVRIADISALATENEVIYHLISRAIWYTREQKKDMLRCILPQDNKYINILRKMGFFIKESKMAFISRLNEPNEELDKKIGDIKSWFVTDIDSDHV